MFNLIIALIKLLLSIMDSVTAYNKSRVETSVHNWDTFNPIDPVFTGGTNDEVYTLETYTPDLTIGSLDVDAEFDGETFDDGSTTFLESIGVLGVGGAIVASGLLSGNNVLILAGLAFLMLSGGEDEESTAYVNRGGSNYA